MPKKEITMIAKNVTPSVFDRRLLQVVSFGGAPLVLSCGTLLVRQVAADPGQVIVGVFAASTLAIGMAVLGVVGSRPTAA